MIGAHEIEHIKLGLDGRIKKLIKGQGVIAGGASTFLQLNDTPDNYGGHAGDSVVVNGGATGLTFTPNLATDELIKVSANDTTTGYLNGKLVAGTGITLTENNDGGNETLSVIGHVPITLDVNADTLLSLSTQTLGLDTQTANKVFSGPALGAAAVPTFRSLVVGDIPDLSGTYQPLDADLTAIAALGFASTSFLKKTAADTWALDTNTYLTSISGLDHGLLSGLTDDDHTQYALLVGRATGQYLYGGIAANDDLTLEGTSHATKTTSYVILQPTSGNVGIGTTSPNEKLEIAGNLRLPATTATTGIIYAGANTFIHNYGINSTWIGVGAGNLTHTSATGQNLGLGYVALDALTTGDRDIAIGPYAATNITTGSYNTAIGYNALGSVTTGDYAIGIGASAGAALVVGIRFTGVGTGAGQANTANHFTGFGAYAGYTHTTGDGCTFIGSSAISNPTTISNAMALGYGSIVGASNTCAIGGTGATYAVKVVINGTTAGAQLQVNADAAATIGQIIKGAASQSANLLNLLSSADAVLGNISASAVATMPNFISSVAIGTQPYATTSTTLNTNLNADLLDGQHGSYYEPSLTKYDLAGTTNQVSLSASGTGTILARNITLSLPQDIHTAATPQFARMGLGQVAVSADILGITSSSTTDLSTGFYIQKTGAVVGTSYGGYTSNTGDSTTNVGQYVTVANADTNVAFYADASVTEGAYSTNLAYAYVANTGDIAIIAGKLLFGTFKSEDTNLYRTAANSLKTDDAFTATQFTSTIATGTSPYACTSTTLNTNLNADLLDGVHGSTFVNAVSDTASIDLTLSGQSISGVVLPAGVDHGGLGGIADDDHTQYALLAGRATGQNLYGGIAANEDITIEGTSHATKTTSYVILQPTAGNVGIGTVSPVESLTLASSYKVGWEASAGVVDTNLYRYGADYLKTDDAFAATQFISTVAQGTPPFFCTSTTLASNLNADYWDGYQFADYLDQAVKTSSTPYFAQLGIGITPTKKLHIAGDFSAAAWTTLGVAMGIVAASYTDTSSSGTVASMAVSNIAIPTILASNATVYTNAATLRIGGAPAASTNVTITNPWSFWVDAGNVRFDNDLLVNGAFGCNAATPQTAYASGGAITDTADATYSANEVTMLGNLKTLINNIRAALVADGIMS